MGVDTIKTFVAWCKKFGYKPCEVGSIIAYGGIRAALKFQAKYGR